MRATGLVRRVDRLGRIVLPIELRLQLGIDKTTLIEVYHDDSSIVLMKHEEGCVLCGGVDDLTQHRGKLICGKCIAEIAQASPGGR